MPKQFHEWVSSMANTIEDASHFVKPLPTAILTPLQIRLNIADLCVPVVTDTNSVLNWLAVFCVTFDNINEQTDRQNLSSVIGRGLADEWYSTEDDVADIRWWNNLRQDILTGRIS